MQPPAAPRVWSVATPIACVTCAVAYAYWATGLRPFTAASYVAVGIPVVVVTAVVVGVDVREPTGDRRVHPGHVLGMRGVVPWLVGILLATGLEVVALALGGRSSAVPTLSTVVDHALAGRAARFGMFCAWLVIGSIPLISAVRRRRQGGVA